MGNTLPKHEAEAIKVPMCKTESAINVSKKNPGGGEIFRTSPARPWGPPSLLYNGYRVFPGGKVRPGRAADPSPPYSAAVKKEWIYTSTPPMGRTACTEPQCLYKGALYPFTFVRKIKCSLQQGKETSGSINTRNHRVNKRQSRC